MEFTRDNTANTHNTSLAGYATVSPATLLAIFGEPILQEHDPRCGGEFVFVDGGGVPFTVYDFDALERWESHRLHRFHVGAKDGAGPFLEWLAAVTGATVEQWP